MPRADFYLIAKPRFLEEPLKLVCELARKSYDANLWTLILAPDFDAPSRALVINLRDDAYLGVCDRVLEVVPADASAREPLRERWKQYKALGLDVNKYDM